MGSRSLGELLLRPSTLTRPSQTSCPHTLRRISPLWTARRCISTSPQRHAQPQRKEDAFGAFDNSDEQPHQTPTLRRTTQAETSQAIDTLFSGIPASRPPPYATRTSPNSGDKLRSSRIYGSQFSDTMRRRPTGRTPGLNFDDMAMPDHLLNPTIANKPSDAATLAKQQEETFANYPRLNPTYGRTVNLDVARGRDIVRGIGMLGSMMARNKVKSDFNKQKFHERGGLKRKRLHSERWRARFKQGFQDITGRVTELTRKGW